MSPEDLPSRSKLIELVAVHTCTRNCFGMEGYAASCCTLENRDWIQGPVPDAMTFVERLSVRFGREVPYSEVFVDYEEGRTLFPERSEWQVPTNYPALRPVMDAEERFPCQFLSEAGACTVYEDRPAMCRDYRCDHLAKVLDSL